MSNNAETNDSYPQLMNKDKTICYSVTKRIVTIGTDANCHIRITDHQMPSRIGHIIYERGKYLLTALNSAIRISVNEITLEKQWQLKHGDRIKFGTNELIFHEFASASFLKVPVSEKTIQQTTATSNSALQELIATIVSILKNRDKDVFNDLVANISRLLKSDAARLVFEDPQTGTRQTIARYPHEIGLDRFSNRAIDWAKNASHTVLASDDNWAAPSYSIEKNRVSSILCAPLKEGELTIGFLYLDRIQNRSSFTEDNRLLCDALIPLFSEILSYHSERQRQQATIDRLQRQELLHSGGMIFACAAMQKVIILATKFAKTESPVLILGETGTGKELLARLIHSKSTRSSKPFKAINCGAIPETLIESELFGYERGAFTGAVARKEGLLEMASGGSIFLDEIAELPLQMQVKLLRTLQENEITRLGGHETVKINVRIIAATNKNIDSEVSNGRFRQDLYFRLNVLTLKLPPLRERENDIIMLADYFNVKYCQQFGTPLKTFTPAAQSMLIGYDWPGNVRELENIIQKAILLSSGSKITNESITIKAPTVKMTLKEARSIAEKELITSTLRKTKGNISLSSKLLEIDRKWLMKIMDDLGIDVEEYRN